MKNIDKRYKYYVHERKDGATEVIAVSRYAGKKVKAKAVCSPEDTFDEEKGKQLARLRCAVKIDEKRLKDIVRERTFLNEMEMWVAENMHSTDEYQMKSINEYKANKAALEAMLKEM